MLHGSLMKLHLCSVVSNYNTVYPKNVNCGEGLKREYTRNVLWEVFRFPFHPTPPGSLVMKSTSFKTLSFVSNMYELFKKMLAFDDQETPTHAGGHRKILISNFTETKQLFKESQGVLDFHISKFFTIT